MHLKRSHLYVTILGDIYWPFLRENGLSAEEDNSTNQAAPNPFLALAKASIPETVCWGLHPQWLFWSYMQWRLGPQIFNCSLSVSYSRHRTSNSSIPKSPFAISSYQMFGVHQAPKSNHPPAMTQLTHLIMGSKEEAEIAPALICLGVRAKAHTMLSLSEIMELLAFAALSSLIQS